MEVFERIVSYIFEFFELYPVQILWALVPICLFAKRRKYFWVRLIPLVSLLILWGYGIDYWVPWLSIGRFAFSFLLQLALTLFIMGFCFEFTVGQVLFYGLAAANVQHLADSLQHVSSIAIWPCVPEAFGMLINLFILFAVYVLFYFAFCRYVRKYEDLFANQILISVFCVVEMLVSYVLNMFVIVLSQITLTGKLFDTFTCLLILSMQFIFVHFGAMQKNNESMKQMLRFETRHQRMAQENIEYLNMKYHDLKHRIASIRALPIHEEVEEELKNIEKAIAVYDSKITTGNAALDTVLTEKNILCEKYGVKFSYVLNGKDFDFLEDEDIYALLDNALDNAIESAQKGKEGERTIMLKARLTGNLLKLHFENNVVGELQFKNGLPMTTKEDKRYHGYGMRSIKYTAEKYGGVVIAKVQEGVFSLDIVLSKSQKTRKI